MELASANRAKTAVVACLLTMYCHLLSSEEAAAGSPPPGHESAGTQACRLGERVLAARAALADPGAPGSLDAILDLGTDSRYYVMVRGWLVMQLQGDLSILAASAGDAPPAVVRRVEFLKRAIRAIDLE